MIVSVASGKGGTGKTTVAVNMALSLRDGVQLLDCDVQEPNDYLFFKIEDYEEKRVYSSAPRVNMELCDGCGKCAEACQFNAIAVLPNRIIIFDQLCHSCGLCSIVCPRKAIDEESMEVGVMRKANLGSIRLVYGVLKT
ncbi:MAG: 4Fe-4S binding protein, partial [Thermoproteota archaeon]